MGADGLPGFYGKFPELGDFVNRRLPRSFLDPWDEWLQNCIATSRGQMEDEWLNAYLTSPVWRFLLSAGLCGEQPWGGLLMPSVDRVGRYYPLIIAAPLPFDANPVQVAVDGHGWFDAAESVILGALDESDFDLEAFDRKVAGLGGLDELARVAAASTHSGFGSAWRIPLDGQARVSLAIQILVHQLVLQRMGAYTLFWGSGSHNVQPSFLVNAGMPAASDFAALLNGDWASSAWEQWSVPVTDGQLPEVPGMDGAQL